MCVYMSVYVCMLYQLIYIQLCIETEEIVIKVSDEGGGIKRRNMGKIWSYLYTTGMGIYIINIYILYTRVWTCIITYVYIRLVWIYI